MRTSSARSLPLWCALALGCAGPSTRAADVPLQADRPRSAAPSEPNVQRIVTEDDNVRVEELRVRGETKRIVVRSRLGRGGTAGEYEILPADNGRDLSQGPAGNRGAAGQRVWHLFSF